MATNPGAWLALLCGLGAILLWLNCRRAGRALVTIAALGFAAIAFLPVDQWALLPLENRFPAAPSAARYDGILVLGGTVESALTQDRGLPALNASAERLTTFVAQARLHPEARLVFTGGPLPSRPQGPPEATGARILLASLGLPADRVTFEAQSRTTWENAVLTHALIQPKPGERWLLITSASHMARSIGAFRKMGWEFDAMPVGYKSFHDQSQRSMRGFGERLSLLDLAAHEWIGLVYYDLRSRSTALFPAP